MSTLKDKENPAFVVNHTTTLIPVIDNAGVIPASVTPEQLGALERDPVTGNVLGNVTPRADTLVNLLAISDAGDGEVATATDVDALVVYRGSPVSVGVPYYRDGTVGYTLGNLSFLSTATGVTNTPHPLIATYDPDSLVASNIINLPPQNIPGETYIVEMIANIGATPGPPLGTNIFITPQRRRISDGLWQGFMNTFFGQINYNGGVNNFAAADSEPIDRTQYDQLRFITLHDSAGTVFLTGKYSLKFKQLKS